MIFLIKSYLKLNYYIRFEYNKVYCRHDLKLFSAWFNGWFAPCKHTHKNVTFHFRHHHATSHDSSWINRPATWYFSLTFSLHNCNLFYIFNKTKNRNDRTKKQTNYWGALLLHTYMSIYTHRLVVFFSSLKRVSVWPSLGVFDFLRRTLEVHRTLTSINFNDYV